MLVRVCSIARTRSSIPVTFTWMSEVTASIRSVVAFVANAASLASSAAPTADRRIVSTHS